MSNFLAQIGLRISDVYSFPNPKKETSRACLFLLFFSSLFNLFLIYHSLFFHPYVLFPLLAHFRPMRLCPLSCSQLHVQIIILCPWTLMMVREHTRLLRSDIEEGRRSTGYSPHSHSDPQLIPPVHQSSPSHQTHSTLNSDSPSPESKTYLQTGSICSHLHSWDAIGWNVKHTSKHNLEVKKETQMVC